MWLRVLLLLVPPVAAFLLVYVGSLGALFVSAFWEVDAFTGKVVHTWNLTNFRDIVKYITAFTIGHSLTLLFGTLAGITASPYLVDAVIAVYSGAGAAPDAVTP